MVTLADLRSIRLPSLKFVSCLSTTADIIEKKSSLLRTPAFICLPWRRPCGNHAKRCMNEKTIQCLPNPSQHVPIYLQQFPSYTNRKCKKSPFSHTAAHIFVSPGDAFGAITLNVVRMEREFDAYKLSRCMCSSNYNCL